MKARKRSNHDLYISFEAYNTWHTVSGNERLEKPRWGIATPLLEDNYVMEDAVALGSLLIGFTDRISPSGSPGAADTAHP